MSPHASMLVLAAIVAVPFAAVFACRHIARRRAHRRAADSFWQIVDADRSRERVDAALHTPTTFDDGWTW